MGVFDKFDCVNTTEAATSSDLFHSTMKEVAITPEQKRFTDLIAANEKAISGVMNSFINVFDKLEPAMREQLLSGFPKSGDQPLYAALTKHYA